MAKAQRLQATRVMGLDYTEYRASGHQGDNLLSGQTT
jgi:hypothetical protein